MRTLRPTLLAALLLLAFGPLHAQITLTAQFKDAASGEPVAFATFSLTRKGESKPYKYCLTDHNGQAKLDKVAQGVYEARLELLGYKSWTKEVSLKQRTEDLGQIAMQADVQTLDAARVSAAGNAVEFKQDTIEYNAASHLIGENDLLEDLLKKLPGVEVDDSGKVTVNGEEVKRITIEGKTFFLNDPTVATRNILAKYVKKVKVVEKKSEQAEFTGIDDGERETVIDIAVHDNMMRGTFGNVNAGIGHDIPAGTKGTLGTYDDWRWQGSGFVGKFTKKRQISLVANVNNTNSRGATDQAGSMMRALGGSANSDNGINTVYMGGVNGAWTLLDNKMELSGSYIANHVNNVSRSESNRISYLADHDLLYNSASASNDRSFGHTFASRLEHKFSEATQILFEPQLSIGRSSFNNGRTYNSDNRYEEGTYKANEGSSLSQGDNNSLSTSGRFLFKQRLGLPGRTLTFNARYSFSHNQTDGINQSNTRTWLDKTGENYQDSVIDQTYVRKANSVSLRGRVTYTEPLGGGFYAEANYSYAWSRNTSTKDTYGADGVRSDLYSNDIYNTHTNQQIGANLKYQKKKFRIQGGVSIDPTHTENVSTRSGKHLEYENDVVNWAPTLSMSWNRDRNESVRVFYSGSSNQPSTSQLLPVPDLSNPTNISFGNPNLKPNFSHSMRAEYRKTNRKTFSSYNVRLTAGITQDPIVSALWYDAGGVQYSIPVNGAPAWNVRLNSTVNTPIGKSKFSVNNTFSGSFRESGSYVGNNVNTSAFYHDAALDYDKFYELYGNIDAAPDFIRNATQTLSLSDNLRLTWRADEVEIRLAGSTRVNKSWYTITESRPVTWNNGASLSFNWRSRESGWGANTTFRYRWYEGYTTARDPEYLWNAEITKTFARQFTLSLIARDILGQEKSMSVSDSSNQHRESVTNTLGRYVIASLTWRFGQRQRGRGGRGGFGGGYGGYGGGGRGNNR